MAKPHWLYFLLKLKKNHCEHVYLVIRFLKLILNIYLFKEIFRPPKKWLSPKYPTFLVENKKKLVIMFSYMGSNFKHIKKIQTAQKLDKPHFFNIDCLRSIGTVALTASIKPLTTINMP